MLFNSYQFWVFFLTVLSLYKGVPYKYQNRILLVASYIFYGAWDWRFLSLILLSTAVDFLAAQRIFSDKSLKKKRPWLIFSVVINLGILGVFKYYNFFVHEMGALLEFFGVELFVPAISLILPVGISFYTFQTMSYTIDVYKNQTQPTNNFFDYALYVSFFPQLVAGPIERSSHLLPQILNARPRLQARDFQKAFYLIVLGLFSKVVIADNMAPLVDLVYREDPQRLSGGEILIGTYAFAFQVYGDFFGYSCIACGIAKLMGFDLMENFKRPYLAGNPREFWRRWHISLSTWLRDYLYISLGGSRRTEWKVFRNLMVTMVCVWFVAWGRVALYSLGRFSWPSVGNLPGFEC